MKLPHNVEYTVKIHNCIDELLMQDMTFNQQTKKLSTKEYQITKNHRKQVHINHLERQRKKQETSNRNESQEVLIVNNKKRVASNISNNINQRRRGRKQVNFHNNQQTEKVKNISNPLHNNLFAQNDKKLRTQILQNQEGNGTVYLNKQVGNQLKLKKTYSNEVKADKNNESDNVIQSGSDFGFPEYLLQTTKDEYSSGNNLLTSIKPCNREGKAPSIGQNIKDKQYQTRKDVIKATFIKQPLIKQCRQKQKQYFKTQGEFNLSHQQLQFLSLLYPNESPQELMLKLLSYYQQEQQYNNSFDQLFQTDQIQQKNQFFRTRHQINLHIPDSIIELQLQTPNKNDFIKYNTYSYQQNQQNNQNNFPQLKQNNFPQLKQNNFPQLKQNNFPKLKQNNYSKLKQQCLAALGRQMVQTQIKNSLPQTANVNYYTRQYAMPIILQTLTQKNQQAYQKLQKLQQTIKNNQQICTQKIQQITMTLNQQKIAAVLAQNYQTINSQFNTIPSQFIHKVYIPANSRGQSFQMDYRPDPKLFEYITQNQYRRILRDINHLIQKVLSYHRHSTFIKRKNGSLLKGWNLALLIFVFMIIAMLYVKSFFVIQSSYLEIIVFFCLSFIVILILGNSFNHYKKNVKRSSVIKDICQQVTNYLDFINSSNKNIKWVLGKDFFWLEIWIDVIKNNNYNKK